MCIDGSLYKSVICAIGGHCMIAVVCVDTSTSADSASAPIATLWKKRHDLKKF